MPIERTKEMDDAFYGAAWHPNWSGGDPDWKAGLDAALAIVERDHMIRPYCNDELAPGIVCKQGQHTDEAGHYAITGTGARVEWS